MNSLFRDFATNNIVSEIIKKGSNSGYNGNSRLNGNYSSDLEKTEMLPDMVCCSVAVVTAGMVLKLLPLLPVCYRT